MYCNKSGKEKNKEGKVCLKKVQKRIPSESHLLYAIGTNKIAISPFHDKWLIWNDGIRNYAYDNYKIKNNWKIKELRANWEMWVWMYACHSTLVTRIECERRMTVFQMIVEERIGKMSVWIIELCTN